MQQVKLHLLIAERTTHAAAHSDCFVFGTVHFRIVDTRCKKQLRSSMSMLGASAPCDFCDHKTLHEGLWQHLALCV
jgi:hypothetical protein